MENIKDSLLHLCTFLKESTLFYFFLIASIISTLLSLFFIPSALREKRVEHSITNIMNNYENVNYIAYEDKSKNLTLLTSKELIEYYKYQLLPGQVLSAQNCTINNLIESSHMTFYFYIDEKLLFNTEIYVLEHTTAIDGEIISSNSDNAYIAKVDGIFRELPHCSASIFE